MALPNTVSAEKREARGASVSLGTGIDVYPDMPLPELNSAGGPAFTAKFKGDSSSDLMAIICNTGLPTRADQVTAMRSIGHSGVLRLIDHGVVNWNDGNKYYCFAYQRPTSPRFVHALDEPHTPMSEDAIARHFILPMAGVLLEFLRTGIVHGNIRSTNLFWRVGSASPPQIGECLSAPTGVGQPVLFETIERGMSMPVGRGLGTHWDDCYAFGVTLALLILGQNPLRGLDDRNVLQMKMERGTFNALIGSHRIGSTHLELLRGLLTDDVAHRWSAADIEQWLNGRRLTPKGSETGRRASRHIDFGGKEFWQLRPLANALASQPTEAARFIESGALDKWLRRALGDEGKANDVNEALISLKESGKTANYEHQLVARACIALDPTAPIRYRGLSLMPTGIAAALAEAVLTGAGANVAILTDIITSQLVAFWVEMQKELKTELVPLAQQIERTYAIFEKSSFGNGVERVVYELNQTLPCLSPLLRGQCVMTPKQILPGLERVAGSSARPNDPIDRHIAAFLIVRDRRSELLFDAMKAPENSPRRSVAMLTLFGEMQQRYGPDTLPHIAQWLLPLLEPSIRRYFSKAVRENLQKQARSMAERGDIGALVRLIDDPKRLERDRQDFVAARLLYLSILKEINALEGKIADRDGEVQSAGKPVAVLVSSMLALGIVIFSIVRVVLHNL